jgi:hypothetical protein
MVRRNCLAILLLLSAPTLHARVFYHSEWQQILSAHVNELGEVDYAAIKRKPASLEGYLVQLAAASPQSHPDRFPSRDHELAYWLNAYNAFTVKGVVDSYPTKSIRDLGFRFGFFRKKAFVAGGDSMSLDHIEHEIIRKQFGDPRIHFAIVCASISCPRLDRDAFHAETLDQHLDQLARRFMSERRNVTITAGSSEIRLSRIFDWFEDDFTRSSGSRGTPAVLSFIQKYADAQLRSTIDRLRNPKLTYHDYDWSLNAPGSRAKAKSALERELASSAGMP